VAPEHKSSELLWKAGQLIWREYAVSHARGKRSLLSPSRDPQNCLRNKFWITRFLMRLNVTFL